MTISIPARTIPLRLNVRWRRMRKRAFERERHTHTHTHTHTLKEVVKGHALNQRCNRMHSLTQLHPNSLKRANVLVIIPVLAGTPLLDHQYGGNTAFNGRLSLHPAHMAVLNHPSFLFFIIITKLHGSLGLLLKVFCRGAALFIFPSLPDPLHLCRPKRHRGGCCSIALDLKLPAL